jgi:hypothetical protein
MKEWFYVKNNLKAREDIKDIIMRPIWQRFGLRKPKVEIDDAAEECQKAFGIVCSFIGTRDLVQEHIAFRVWPLVEQWEMPKETISKPDEGGLVRLKYTFRYEGKFIEPDDDWLKCIEATSDELLGPYSKTEDNALSATFGGRKKKRLNRVFDAIGFMYPDYRYPLKGQKRKSATSGKGDTSVALSEAAPKRKRVKVLTHRPRFIEPALVPEFGGETSTATEAKEPTPSQKIDKLTATPKAERIEEPRAERTKTTEILSPSAEVEVPKSQKGPAMTPKRKRMVNVLDVLETIKSSSTTPKKIAETPEVQIEAFGAEATKHQAETEAGPSELAKVKSLETKETEAAEQILAEETGTAAPEAFSEAFNYILRHASGKKLAEKEKQEAQFYAQKIEISKGGVDFQRQRRRRLLVLSPRQQGDLCLSGDGKTDSNTRRRALSVVKR